LEELANNYNGVFLSSLILHRRDERNLQTLLNIAPDDFNMFVPAHSKSSNENPNVIVLFNYTTDSTALLADQLQEYKHNKIRTAIYLSNDNDESTTTSSVEPFELATEIASLMDASLGGSDFVCVSSSLSDDDDYVIRLCEELSYLDVPGPTMKSRLMLDCDEESSEDLVDEVMMIGVNKFVVREDGQQLIQSVAKEQGKQLVSNASSS
jgi:hypothetical protein